jgi:DNA-binding MarR family transcriptional regulator
VKRWAFERAVLASDLAAPARHILLSLAVLADWPGGIIPAQFSPSLTKLAESTGLSRRAVMNHLNALEKKEGQEGWVIRSRPEIEKARSEKERTSYRLGVPARARRALEAREPDALARAGDALEVGQEVPWARARRAHNQDLLQTNNQTAGTSPERIVAETTGATPEEAAAVATRVRNEREPRNLVGLLRRMATDGDLSTLLTEHRAAVVKARVAADIAEARRKPDCEHGTPGGDQPHPVTGHPLCPLCRARSRWSAVTA